MKPFIQYVALAKDVEHWNAGVKCEFSRALSHYLAVAIRATSADEALPPTVKAFRIESLANLMRQITEVVTSKVTHIDLAADILQDAGLLSLFDTCIQCAFEETQRNAKNHVEPLIWKPTSPKHANAGGNSNWNMLPSAPLN